MRVARRRGDEERDGVENLGNECLVIAESALTRFRKQTGGERCGMLLPALILAPGLPSLSFQHGNSGRCASTHHETAFTESRV